MNKKYWFIIIAAAIVLMFVFSGVMYSNSSVICAKYSRMSKMRSHPILIYHFVHNGNYREGNMEIGDYTKEQLEELKTGCIKVEVSNYWGFFNHAIDQDSASK